MSNTYNDRRRAARPRRDEEVFYNDRRRAARLLNIISWVLTLIGVGCAIGAFALIIRNELARPAPVVIATVAPAARPVIVQPVTIDPDRPADAQPTARSVAAPPAQPAAAPPAGAAPGFSPVDLGDVPAVPATSLSAEQYEAAQASEEQNYLNSVNSTLTGAQRGVAEYNACVAAGGCGVVK